MGKAPQSCPYRPVREGQSLILLVDDTTLRDMTVVNSDGNGVSNQPGARVLITRNAIGQHGQHGLLLSGPQEAVVLDNRLVDNGTKQFRPVTPRQAAGRQGHHIFVQGKSGVANSLVLTGNTMQRAFADGLALVVFFDEADGVTMPARVINNTIEASERRGVTIAGSFGPSHNRVTINISHNTICPLTRAGYRVVLISLCGPIWPQRFPQHLRDRGRDEPFPLAAHAGHLLFSTPY